MTLLKSLTGLLLAFGLSACAAPDSVSRDTPRGLTLATREAVKDPLAGQRVALPLNVVDVVISVPSALRVSEAETFYPIADVVWRGDPRGNRLEQVAAIWETAAATAVQPLTQGVPVIAEVEVTRFHCLTEKTRNTIGGTHALAFELTVRHAETGEILDGPRVVVADVKASGGTRAIAEDYAGRTQKVVVTERLASVLRRELTTLKLDPASFGLQVSMSPAEPGRIVLSAKN